MTCDKLFSFMVVRNVINSKPIYFTDDYFYILCSA